jgi:hypothetical protein
MEDISLREYIRKIENLIDTNEINQAIAHCKHILQIYPKHIDSYRLLGKALLEKQKYGDASDIFQRVLSSVPDDFISHIGMSIIREDENNLDASIWHMERAFEVQPSNKAVQDELRRLYTKRDGVAPSKIRLTRGALVRMYTRGELYDQAIGEINAALSEDPNRVDLEVILAKIYFLLGQKVEATETCSNLISKLPYCYEANKILTEVLPGTTREEDQKIFRQRVIDLDPYFQFTNENLPNSTDVSDSSIKIGYLEWDPMSGMYDQPDWAQSIGLAIENEKTKDNDFTDWLDDSDNIPNEPLQENSNDEENELIGGEDAPDETSHPESIEDHEEEKEYDTKAGIEMIMDDEDKNPEPGLITDDDATIESSESIQEDLPEWIREAGWQKSDNENVDAQKDFTIQSILSEARGDNNIQDDDDAIEPAEIPDWIKEIAPAEESSSENVLEEEDEFEIQNLENLFKDIEKSGSENIQDKTISQWDNEFSEDEFKTKLSEIENIDPDLSSKESDFKSELIDESKEKVEDEIDWLKNFSAEDDRIEDVDIDKLEVSSQDFDTTSINPIISDKEFNPSDEIEQTVDDDDDWLSSLIDKVDQGDENETFLEKSQLLDDTDEVEKAEESTENIPEWIKSVMNEENNQESEIFEESKSDSPDWLTLSESEIDEKIDDIKISFDENEDIPLTEEIQHEDIGNDFDKDQDDYEEQLVEESLTKLEHAMVTDQVDELTESDDAEFEDKETADESQSDQISKSDEFESTMAWMESLATKQVVDDENLRNKAEDLKESLPSWISEISDEAQEDIEDVDTTPSWLKELEIETDEAGYSEEEISPPLMDQTSEETISEEIFGDQLDSENEIFIEDEEKITEPVDEVIFEVEEELSETKDEFVTETAEDISEPEDEFVPESEDVLSEPEKEVIPESAEDITEKEYAFIPESEEDVTETEDAFTLESEEEVTEIEDEVIPESEDEEFDSVGEMISEPEEELTVDIGDAIPEVLEASYALDDETISEKVDLDDDASSDTEDDSISAISETSRTNLEEAQKLLQNGNIEESIDVYKGLVRENLFIDEIITDIQSALNHHYPIDINLWQTLGDAHLKNKQLQEALDAYSKAEDLLS